MNFRVNIVLLNRLNVKTRNACYLTSFNDHSHLTLLTNSCKTWRTWEESNMYLQTPHFKSKRFLADILRIIFKNVDRILPIYWHNVKWSIREWLSIAESWKLTNSRKSFESIQRKSCHTQKTPSVFLLVIFFFKFQVFEI